MRNAGEEEDVFLPAYRHRKNRMMSHMHMWIVLKGGSFFPKVGVFPLKIDFERAFCREIRDDRLGNCSHYTH